jgi:hypothetical protein
MKWTNIETKSPPFLVGMVLLRRDGTIAFGMLVEKISDASNTVMKFRLAGYGTEEYAFDITHYHIPKPPDGRTKPI